MPLLEGLCSPNLCGFEFSVFWVFRFFEFLFLNQFDLADSKIICGFARKSPTTFRVTTGTKCANSKTNSILSLLGIDRWEGKIRTSLSPGTLLTKHLKYDACASTLLPEILFGMRRAEPHFASASESQFVVHWDLSLWQQDWNRGRHCHWDGLMMNRLLDKLNLGSSHQLECVRLSYGIRVNLSRTVTLSHAGCFVDNRIKEEGATTTGTALKTNSMLVMLDPRFGSCQILGWSLGCVGLSHGMSINL